MTLPREAQARVDAYIGRFRQRLAGARKDETREFAEEMRSHIMDRVTASGDATLAAIDAVLTALGPADELADQYTTDVVLARARESRSPARLLDGVIRWASVSAAGAFVLVGSLLGYTLAIAFAACAVLKPLHPHAAGLWSMPDGSISLRVGFAGVPSSGRELLGWWIVPLGLLVGSGLVILTTRWALWCARVYRQSVRLPR